MREEEVCYEVRKILDLAYPEQVSATAFPGDPEMQWCNSCKKGQKHSKKFTPNRSECHKSDCQLQQDLNLVWTVCTAVTPISSVQQSTMTQGDWEQHSAQDIQHPAYPKLKKTPLNFMEIHDKGNSHSSLVSLARTKLQGVTLLPVVIGYLSLPSPASQILKAGCSALLMTLTLLFLLYHGLLL